MEESDDSESSTSISSDELSTSISSDELLLVVEMVEELDKSKFEDKVELERIEEVSD